MQGGGDADDDDAGHYFFFSAPASPVHYILRSPPSSTAAATAPASHFPADGDDCGCAGDDFEFAARGGAMTGFAGGAAAATMSSAEELFVAGRIRVGCLSPIRQESSEGRHHEDDWDDEEDGENADEAELNGRSPPRGRRARSASPTRSPRSAGGAEASESDPFASSSSSSTSSSSSSSAKNIRRRISLRDLLARTGGECAGAAADQATGGGIGRAGFWPASIWPSRSSKKALLPCPSPSPAPPQPGRRSASSAAVAPAGSKRAPGGSARRTTSLPYRQGLVLGCLGFGARSYGLAKSMHPLSTR